MRKKNLGLCLFTLLWAVSFSIAAVPKVEHLVWSDTGLDAIFCYELAPPDPTVRLDYVSDPILKFKVPGSTTGNTIFLEWIASLFFEWSGDANRVMVGEISYRINNSLVIPAGVIVKGGMTLDHQSSNNAIDAGRTGGSRMTRFNKAIMRQGYRDYWGVYFEATGDPYPDPEGLLAKLLKKGFEVEVRAEGIARGVSLVQYIQISCHVTRLGA